MTTPAPSCTWEVPCNLGTCTRCFRRLTFQAAKGRLLKGRDAALRLSILRDQLHPPPIEPTELQQAGDFLLTHGYVRPSLDAIGRGQQVVMQVELLEGEHAGLSFVLVLPALDHRVQLVDLLRRTGGPIGPCVLVPRYLDPSSGTWSICSREPDGSLWDPFGVLPDDPPAPGSDPVPFW